MPQGAYISALSQDLNEVSLWDPQPLLWNHDGDHGNALDTYFGGLNASESYGEAPTWIATVPNGTTTGVLEQSTLRVNSSTSCANIDLSDFPTTCLGSSPFTASYNANKTKLGNVRHLGSAPFIIDICSPGNTSASPWSTSLNRQDISEELYIRYTASNDSNDANFLPSSIALHCRANTTLGSFVLGNYANGNQASDISVFNSTAAEPTFVTPHFIPFPLSNQTHLTLHSLQNRSLH